MKIAKRKKTFTLLLENAKIIPYPRIFVCAKIIASCDNFPPRKYMFATENVETSEISTRNANIEICVLNVTELSLVNSIPNIHTNLYICTYVLRCLFISPLLVHIHICLIGVFCTAFSLLFQFIDVTNASPPFFAQIYHR